MLTQTMTPFYSTVIFTLSASGDWHAYFLKLIAFKKYRGMAPHIEPLFGVTYRITKGMYSLGSICIQCEIIPKRMCGINAYTIRTVRVTA